MKKAKRLRAETGNQNIYAAHEQERSAAGRLWKVSLVRPIRFLFTEPVCLVVSFRGFTSMLKGIWIHPDNLPLRIDQWINLRNYLPHQVSLTLRGHPQILNFCHLTARRSP